MMHAYILNDYDKNVFVMYYVYVTSEPSVLIEYTVSMIIIVKMQTVFYLVAKD